MTSPITAPSLRPSSVTIINPDATPSPASANVFRSILADSIQQVQNRGDIANRTIQQFLMGENQDLHEVALATQKAELTFEFFTQARNKVVQAYQEIMRMQL